MISTVFTIVFAGCVSLFMAWTIGAGSSGSTPFAPAVGANAISTMSAGLYVGILGLLGATLQGTNVAEAVGTELIKNATLEPISIIIALFIAGFLMALGIWKGYPISSAFVVTGAVIGAGLALGGDPAWYKYTEIILMWVVGPIFGIFGAYGLMKLFQTDKIPTPITTSLLVFIVSIVILNVEFYIPNFGMIPISEVVSDVIGLNYSRTIFTLFTSTSLSYYTYSKTKDDADKLLKNLLLIIGAIVAFSAGGSQVGLAVGPLLPLSGDIPLSTTGIVIGGGIGILIGSWTGAPRMIKAVSQDYAQLGPRRSISALTPAFILAQAAILFGVPISFNQMIVSCIVGAGLGSNSSSDDSVGKRKMILTVGAWVGTLALSFATTYISVFTISIYL